MVVLRKSESVSCIISAGKKVLWCFPLCQWLLWGNWLCHQLSGLCRQVTQHSFLFFKTLFFTVLFHWNSCETEFNVDLKVELSFLTHEGRIETWGCKNRSLDHYYLSRPAHNSSPAGCRWLQKDKDQKHHPASDSNDRNLSKCVAMSCIRIINILICSIKTLPVEAQFPTVYTVVRVNGTHRDRSGTRHT